MSLLEGRSLPQDLSTEDTDQDTHTNVHTNTDTHTDTHSNTPSDTDTHTDSNINMQLSCMQTDTHLNPHPNTCTNNTQPETQPRTCQSSHTQRCLTDTAAAGGHASVSLHSQETEAVIFKAVCIQTNDDDDDEEGHRLKDAAGDSGSPDPAQKPVVSEDSSSSPAVIPRWDRKPIPPAPPGLERPCIPPPVPPKRKPKPPTLLPKQHAPVLGGDSEESPGLVLGPPGPGVQASLAVDTSAMYATVIHKSQQTPPCPQPCPPLGCAPQEKHGGYFQGTGGIPIQEPPQLMEQEMEGVYRAQEMAGVDVSVEATMTPAPIPKPPRRNRPNPMLQEPVVGTKEGPDMEAFAGSVVEARCSLQALHLAPPGAESVKQPRDMLSASGDQGSGTHTALRQMEEEEDQSPVGELEDERGQGQAVCHRGSLSSLSSFRLFYNPTSLVEEIFTGDEWSSYLLVNSNPSSSQFTGQSEVETQPLCGGDQQESGPVPPLIISDHSDEGNHSSTMDLPDYEIMCQYEEGALVDKQRDAAQEELNNEWRGRDIGIIPKAVLANGAKQQKVPVSKLKTEDIYDNIDLSCVKSLGVLDSSPQKHRIYLSRKRKSRRPRKKPRGDIFKIPRFGIFKSAAHSSIIPSSPLVSSSPAPSSFSLSPSLSAYSPSSPSNGFFSSSIFYPAPSSPLSPLSNDEVGSQLKTGEDGTKYGVSSPRSLAKFMSTLKEKARRKNKQ
ncbi:uncharacterized protein si:dkey-9i23.6 [Osmerus eperlanus]|uniref:uncharacterized protein si:dkey-9i23.6 n=1 Tax=Osmerus eperlanus TaxID=29151 RepID=UPI002E100B69